MKIKEIARSWKTTWTGIVLIIGGISTLVIGYKNHQLTTELITTGLGSIGTGIGFLFTKDHDVTGDPPVKVETPS